MREEVLNCVQLLLGKVHMLDLSQAQKFVSRSNCMLRSFVHLLFA